MIEACVFYSLIGALDPKLAFNDGMRDVVQFVYAPNTVTNASAPAPVSSYQAGERKTHRRDPRSAGAVPPRARASPTAARAAPC